MAYSNRGRPANEIVQPYTGPIIPFSEFGRVFTSDDTLTVQKAIDWSSENGIAVGQEGEFRVNAITLKHHVRIIAPGVGTCWLLGRALSAEPDFIHLDTDIVGDIQISGMTIDGDGVSQNAMRLRAIPGMATGYLQGGLWYFLFKDLDILGFHGEGVWLDGYGNAPGDPAAFRGPIQFGQFRNVRVNCASDLKRSLRMSGQCGQIDFDMACQFNNGAAGAYVSGNSECVMFERAVNLDETLNSDIAPYAINFNGSSIQGNRRGVTIERAQAVNFNGVLFENLFECVLNSVSAWGNCINDCSFFQCGHKGDGTGFIVRNSGGLITVKDPKYNSSGASSPIENHYQSWFDQPIILEGAHIDGATAIKTTGMTRNAMAAASSIDILYHKDIYINGSTTINTIVSQHYPGTIVYLRANGGAILLGSSGNIDSAPHRMPLRVPANATVTLQMNDLSGVWKVVGLSGPRGQYRSEGVFVNASMSPYQILPDSGTVRVDCSAGAVTVKLPSINDTTAGHRITVRKTDGSANPCYINGATTPENPDGQPNNSVRLLEVAQSIDFERNGFVGTQNWDSVATASMASGTPHDASFASLIVAAGGIQITGGASVATNPGVISKNSGSGLVISLIAGSSYDLYVLGPGGSILTVAHNTPDVTFYRHVDVSGTLGVVGGILVTGSGSLYGTQGTIVINAGNGLALQGKTGTFADFYILRANGGSLMWNPTGTANMSFGGDINAVQYSIGGAIALARGGGGYTLVYNSIGIIAMYLGAVGIDPANYYDNNMHYFRVAAGASNIMAITATGDIQLLIGSRGFTDTAGTRRVSVTTSGVDITGTMTVSSTVNLMSSKYVLGSTVATLAVPISITTAIGGTGLNLTDTAGHTGISFVPLNSTSAVFFDNGRVGSSTYFRCSNVSQTDRNWLVVSGGGVAQFGYAVTIAGALTVSGLLVGQASLNITGNMLCTGVISTGAPSGGTSAQWKLGSRVTSGCTTDFNKYLEVDIAGTLYKVMTAV